jgi:hypothetical protein
LKSKAERPDWFPIIHLKNNRIVNVFATEEGLLIQTQLNGIYRLTGTSLSKFSTEVDSEMMANSVYSCDQLSDGSYVIGTVSMEFLF